MAVPPIPPQAYGYMLKLALGQAAISQASMMLQSLLPGRSRKKDPDGAAAAAQKFTLARDQAGYRLQKELQVDRQSLEIEREHWPLQISPKAFRRDEALGDKQRLTMVYIPPQIADDALMTGLRTQHEGQLRDVLGKGHPSVRFLGGWERSRPRDTSALETLYDVGPAVPTALIQVDHVGNSLQLLTGCYSFAAPAGMTHAPIFSGSGRIDWAEHGSAIARKNIQRLKRLVDALPEAQRPNLDQLGEDPLNIALLQLEQGSGERLDAHFRLSAANLWTAAEIAGPALQLLAVGMADFFYLQHHRTSPSLPALLGTILAGFPEASVQAELTMEVLENYQRPYVAMCEAMGADAPSLLADFAHALAECPIEAAKGTAAELLAHAISKFLHDRQRSQATPLIDYARDAPPDDRPFLGRIAQTWRALGDSDKADALDRAMTTALTSTRSSWDDFIARAARSKS